MLKTFGKELMLTYIKTKDFFFNPIHELITDVLDIFQCYGVLSTDANMYVWLTNHPRSEDQYVSVHYTIGPEGWSTNYETRYDG